VLARPKPNTACGAIVRVEYRGSKPTIRRVPVELVDIVIPDPGPGEVVVDIETCGV